MATQTEYSGDAEFRRTRSRSTVEIFGVLSHDMYKIRTAMVDDAEAFSPLLASLGYPSDTSSLRTRIAVILKNPDAVLLVATSESSKQGSWSPVDAFYTTTRCRR